MRACALLLTPATPPVQPMMRESLCDSTSNGFSAVPNGPCSWGRRGISGKWGVAHGAGCQDTYGGRAALVEIAASLTARLLLRALSTSGLLLVTCKLLVCGAGQRTKPRAGGHVSKRCQRKQQSGRSLAAHVAASPSRCHEILAEQYAAHHHANIPSTTRAGGSRASLEGAAARGGGRQGCSPGFSETQRAAPERMLLTRASCSVFREKMRRAIVLATTMQDARVPDALARTGPATNPMKK